MFSAAKISEDKELKSVGNSPAAQRDAFVAKSILKPPSDRLSAGQNTANFYQSSSGSGNRAAAASSTARRSQKNRHPLYQFRQKGTRFRPLFEMFLCYGQEEFIDVKDPTE